MPTNLAFSDTPTCARCRFGCAVALQQPSAIGLLDSLPWSFLSKKKNAPWTMASPSEEDAGIYLAAWFSSTKTKPCLLKCLDGALCQILLVKMGRLNKDDLAEAELWLKQVRTELVRGVSASMVALLVQRADVDELLHIALAFWIEAAMAYDAKDDRKCVASLLQAYLYLGVVSGPALAAERSKEAAKPRSNLFRELTSEAIRLLKRFPEKHFQHVAHAKAAIIEDLTISQDKLLTARRLAAPEASPPKVVNVDKFLSTRCEPKCTRPLALELRTEFERVSVAMTGRPRVPRRVKSGAQKRRAP